MKKLITLILVLSAWNSFAQLTFVKETNIGAKPFLLTNGEWMLYNNGQSIYELSNIKTKNINLFKSDLSLYKVISIPQIFPHDTVDFDYNEIKLSSLEVVGYNSDNNFIFTDNFFNTDSKIEFVIVYRSVKTGKYRKETKIVFNEDAQEIIKFSSSLNGFIDMSFWKYLNIVFGIYNSNPEKTKIYSVPGNLPCPSSCNQKPASISPIDPSNAVNKLSIEGFPNPTSEKITLAYTLPKGSPYGTIRLYSQTGTLVKEFKVSDQFDHLELPVADYAAGTYFYELQVDGNSSGGKKMLVVH